MPSSPLERGSHDADPSRRRQGTDHGLAAHESALRHRDRAGRQDAADHRHRAGKARYWTGGPRALRPLQSQGVDGLRQIPEGSAERQTDRGFGNHPDASGRRQNHDYRRPDRRAQPSRQESDAVHSRALARPLLRRQGWRCGRRLRTGRADGGHQSAFHRRPACHRHRPQLACGVGRQSHLLGQCARHRQPACGVAARDGHERSGAALDRLLARRRCQRLSTRRRLRHHGGLRGDGNLLPRQGSRRSQATPVENRDRLYARPQAGARRRDQGAWADGRAAQAGARAQSGTDARRHARLHPWRAVRQHRARLQFCARHHNGAEALRLRRDRGGLRL